MLRESPGLFDKRSMPAPKADLIFAKFKSKRARHLSYEQWCQALAEVAVTKFPKVKVFQGVEGVPIAPFLKLMWQHILKAKWGPSCGEGGVMQAAKDMGLNHMAHYALKVQRTFRNKKQREAGREFLAGRASLVQQMKMGHAALLMQSLWRRFKARMTLVDRLHEYIEKCKDPKTGAFFYNDSRTGATSWYKPSLLRGSDIRRVIVIPDTDTEYRIICSQCEEVAEVACEHCGDIYCRNDFLRLHKKGSRAKHAMLEIPKCDDCKYQAASRRCSDEKECFGGRNYCDTCWLNYHRTKAQRLHDHEVLTGLCPECDKYTCKWHCEHCDDQYCGRCMKRLHQRGNMSTHPYILLPYWSLGLKKRFDDVAFQKVGKACWYLVPLVVADTHTHTHMICTLVSSYLGLGHAVHGGQAAGGGGVEGCQAGAEATRVRPAHPSLVSWPQGRRCGLALYPPRTPQACQAVCEHQEGQQGTVVCCACCAHYSLLTTPPTSPLRFARLWATSSRMPLGLHQSSRQTRPTNATWRVSRWSSGHPRGTSYLACSRPTCTPTR